MLRREMREEPEYKYRFHSDASWMRKCDSLTAERDSLRAVLSQVTEERDAFMGQADSLRAELATAKEHALAILAMKDAADQRAEAAEYDAERWRKAHDGILAEAERMVKEATEATAAASMILLSRHCPDVKPDSLEEALEAKRLKIEKFLKYSEEVGTLERADAEQKGEPHA